MNTLKIKTYSKNVKLTEDCFFILSKGNNAGKPLIKPCPNCFVFLSCDKEEKDFFFWLTYGLWQGNYFKQVLCGSVIPFIRIHELKTIIFDASVKAQSKSETFSKTVNYLKNLDEQQKNIQKQMHLIQQVKASLMYTILKQ
jgi:hypothetical protein